MIVDTVHVDQRGSSLIHAVAWLKQLLLRQLSSILPTSVIMSHRISRTSFLILQRNLPKMSEHMLQRSPLLVIRGRHSLEESGKNCIQLSLLMMMICQTPQRNALSFQPKRPSLLPCAVLLSPATPPKWVSLPLSISPSMLIKETCQILMIYMMTRTAGSSSVAPSWRLRQGTSACEALTSAQ